MQRSLKKIAVLLCVLSLVLTSTLAFAATTKAQCPRKVLETRTVEGIFDGAECGDFCHATLKLDNGEFFSAFADPDEVTNIYGAQTGMRVSMTYTVEQYWEFENVEETNPNGPGVCTKAEFFKTGAVLASQKQGGASRPAQVKTYLLKEKGSTGELALSRLPENPSFMTITINTVYEANMSACGFEGRCIEQNGILFCPVKPTTDATSEYCHGNDCMIKIRVKGNGLEVIEAPYSELGCGMNATIHGLYTLKR